MKISFILCAALALLTFGGCGDATTETPASAEVTAMDTVMSLQAYGEEAEAALDDAEAEIHRLDGLLSISSVEGDIASLNAHKHADLSEDTARLLGRAIAISEDTDGAFDPTIAPLMSAWGFSSKAYHVPDAATINALLPAVDATRISLDKNGHCRLPQDTAVDLGGIAKGYTAEQVMAIFEQHGVTSALISLGGNIQTLGSKPDGSPWRIGIQNPFAPDDIIATLQIHNRAVVTSGGYLRYFEQDGKRYHHILDPHTGRPAESGLASVSIITKDGTLADALSTALFVIGEADAIRYWREHRNDFDTILVTDDGRILVTPNLAKAVQCANGHETEVIA